MELHIKRKYAGEYDPFILSHKAKQVTYVLYPTSKREKHDWWAVTKSRPHVDVQDIGTLVHESGKLESVEIRGRNSIGDEDDNNKDEEEVEWESNDEEWYMGLSYSSSAPISTPSSSSSATWTTSRRTSSSSAHPPIFNKQLACAKSITEIIKEHFVEAHASSGKIFDRIKNMSCTKFKPKWIIAPQYASLYDAWSSNAFKNKREAARGNVCKGVVAKGLESTPAGLAGENRQGIFIIRVVHPTASAKGTVGRHAI
ncbi:hypothetical protein M9H77_03217 [Catharanthus roseus]|uniref:Uncharacterized protein n=1 Tax=Catharanthus roseus TaxID=4058 RepID=A0ACC0CB22_CATRO|nr:hypothetical protein M9H77_03217 [Catharanthus roseus]